MNIETLLQDTKSDRAKFLAYVGEGIQKVADILDRDYERAIKALQAKARR